MDHEKERCVSDLSARSFSIAVARFVSCYDYGLGRWSVSITRVQRRPIYLRPLIHRLSLALQRLVRNQLG